LGWMLQAGDGRLRGYNFVPNSRERLLRDPYARRRRSWFVIHSVSVSKEQMMLVPAFTSTRAVLEELLAQRILLLDGSMGAFLYSRGLQEEDYRGKRFRNHPKLLKNCTEALVLTQPGLIEDIHRAYLDAGADIIETCTFNGTPLALTEFGM